MNFFRAIAIAARPDEPWSITSDYNSVLLSYQGQPPGESVQWLDILLTWVVKHDREEEVPKCESALEISINPQAARATLGFSEDFILIQSLLCAPSILSSSHSSLLSVSW
ncbi:hypothetical protein BDV34DRAFT_207911 [Aspergillus parasiticus]|uniref:Uncharacterized protein n=1 Tax=Aspergillus parasiticus TaxID=5067 RepID=A0A5N6D128_ASPPA|nr:hypothetical protein BDV34DRAFT_207911 [Aspergillus parasiticus]